jgi:hypothetical protein
MSKGTVYGCYVSKENAHNDNTINHVQFLNHKHRAHENATKLTDRIKFPEEHLMDCVVK